MNPDPLLNSAEEAAARAAFWLERATPLVTKWTGTSVAILMAAGVIVVWALLGARYNLLKLGLIVNTGTTISPPVPEIRYYERFSGAHVRAAQVPHDPPIR